MLAMSCLPACLTARVLLTRPVYDQGAGRCAVLRRCHHALYAPQACAADRARPGSRRLFVMAANLGGATAASLWGATRAGGAGSVGPGCDRGAQAVAG